MAGGRQLVCPLVALLLLFGAVGGGSLTCFDDLSLDDDPLEVEAVTPVRAKPEIKLHPTLPAPSKQPRPAAAAPIQPVVADAGSAAPIPLNSAGSVLRI